LGPVSTIILIPLQFGVFVLISLYLVYSSVELRRRNQREWPAIVRRLSPAWNAAGSAMISSGPDRLWAMYRDAGALMELADYAERSDPYLDDRAIQELRGDALRIRFNALKAFVTRSSLR